MRNHLPLSPPRQDGLLPLLVSFALTGAAPAVAANHPPIEIEVRDQLISLSAEEVSARLLLEHLAQQCGLVLEIETPLEQRLSLSLRKRPLHEVIARLLGDHSYVLHFRRALRDEAGGGYLWVLSDSDTKATAPVDPLIQQRQREAKLAALDQLLDQKDDSTLSELRHAAGDVDPAVRAAAIRGLGEIGETGDDAWLRLALSDADEAVREAAIEAIASLGGGFAAQALASALNDRASARREQALYALADLPSAEVDELLDMAQSDGDPRLRELAAELLAERRG